MSIQNKTRKKILLCPDKFKGSLSSASAANAITRGIQKAVALSEGAYNLQFRSIAIADGGDGSQEVIEQLYKGEKVPFSTYNAIGEPIIGEYLLYNINGQKQAFVEMARICGLAMLEKENRNPLYTTTYGLGEAIKDAIGKGAQTVTLSIGGSATNDGGTGLLQSLGYRFYNKDGILIEGSCKAGRFLSGRDLAQIKEIKCNSNGLIPENVQLRVICDVNNPLLGKNGATYVYGPQKGADEKMLQALEYGMENYVKSNQPKEIYALTPGAGAAGGVGFACVAYLGATLIGGWKFFAELTQLEENIKWADIIITGEGSIDSQSLQGKVIDGVLTIANKYNKKVAAFCGISSLSKEDSQILKCYQLVSIENDIEKCISNADNLLEELAFKATNELLD